MKDLVSIIIPTYNRGELIGMTLNSILLQAYSNWECIIVDDHSEDYTSELMEFYTELDSRMKYYKRPASISKGANSCRNFGFSLSKGNFINWFDSDDVMQPNFIGEKVGKLIAQSNVCCISSFSVFEFTKGRMNIMKEYNIGKERIFENVCLGNFRLPTNSPLWKRSFLENKGLFDESLTISQDLEFYSRILPEDVKISVLEESLYLLRRGHSTLTSELYKNIDKHFPSYFLVRQKIVIRNLANSRIKYYYKSELMDMFRFLLGKKKYSGCNKILRFFQEYYCTSFLSQLRLLKLWLLFLIIRSTGRGDTKFRKSFKI